MAETNFTLLLDAQKTTWGRSIWKSARQASFLMQRMGQGMNSAITRITELTTTERGTKAIITLVPDLTGDGVMGDTEVEGKEEAAAAYDQEINVDQLRNAIKSAGRMAEQGTVVRFRETARDLLGFWMADRVDQLGSLTMSGIDYRLKTNGALRDTWTHNGTAYSRGAVPIGETFFDRADAADVTPPSANRGFRWDASAAALRPADTGAIEPADTLSYAALVEARAFAKDRRLRSLRGGDMALFHVFMHPSAMAKLKLDPDFLANLRSAGQRGGSNPLFSGSLVTVDGLVLHEFTHSFNTLGAATGTSSNAGTPGFKWGADANVNGNRVVMMGAQGLAFADLSIPQWDERNHFDYGAKPGIAASKICGFLKPVFYNPWEDSEEDFGVMTIDVAI